MNDRTIVQHPNGYSGILMGKSTMMIYDKDDNLVLHTCFRTPNTETELYECLETMPQFMDIIASVEADRKTEPRGCDADCNEDCAECAEETRLWKEERFNRSRELAGRTDGFVDGKYVKDALKGADDE